MAVYLVAEFCISDRRRFDDFRTAFGAAVIASGGEFIAAEAEPVVLLGESDFDRMGIMRFESREAVLAFTQSEQMNQLSILREAACSMTRVVMLQDLDLPAQALPSGAPRR